MTLVSFLKHSNFYQQFWRIACLSISVYLLVVVSIDYFDRRALPSVELQETTTFPSLLLCANRQKRKSIANAISSIAFKLNDKILANSLTNQTNGKIIGQFDCVAPSAGHDVEADQLSLTITGEFDDVLYIYAYDGSSHQLFLPI